MSTPYIHGNAKDVVQFSPSKSTGNMSIPTRTDRTLPADTLGAIVQIDVPEYAGVDFRIVRVYSDGMEREKRDLRSDSHALTVDRGDILYKYRRVKAGYPNSKRRRIATGTGKQWSMGKVVPLNEQMRWQTKGRFVRVCGREFQLDPFLRAAVEHRIWIRGNWKNVLASLRSRSPHNDAGFLGDWEFFDVDNFDAKQAGTECLDAWTEWYTKPNDAIEPCPGLHPDFGFTYTPKPPSCSCTRKKCAVCRSMVREPPKRFMKWEDMAKIRTQHGENAFKRVLSRSPYNIGYNTYRSYKNGPRKRKRVTTRILSDEGMDRTTPQIIRDHVAPVRSWLQAHREDLNSFIQFGHICDDGEFKGCVVGAPNVTSRMFADFKGSEHYQEGINVQSFMKMVRHVEKKIDFRPPPGQLCTTGDVRKGSRVLVVKSTVGILPKMRVEGSHIPSSATVVRVEEGGRVVVSQGAVEDEGDVEIRFLHRYGTKRKRTYTETRNRPSFLYVGTR